MVLDFREEFIIINNDRSISANIFLILDVIKFINRFYQK